jgi:hypothetical protein
MGEHRIFRVNQEIASRRNLFLNPVEEASRPPLGLISLHRGPEFSINNRRKTGTGKTVLSINNPEGCGIDLDPVSMQNQELCLSV